MRTCSLVILINSGTDSDPPTPPPPLQMQMTHRKLPVQFGKNASAQDSPGSTSMTMCLSFLVRVPCCRRDITITWALSGTHLVQGTPRTSLNIVLSDGAYLPVIKTNKQWIRFEATNRNTGAILILSSYLRLPCVFFFSDLTTGIFNALPITAARATRGAEKSLVL
jgi:hypothetical protein